MADLLIDFTAYIESLCVKHVDIGHDPEGERHFVELSTDKMMQKMKSLYYPFVTLDKLTITYPWTDDNRRKRRYLELMFLDNVSDTGDFIRIQAVKNHMEQIAEEFLMKIDEDRKDRRTFPFLRGLVMEGIEINYIENESATLYGVLLSAQYELPFPGCLSSGRFL